MTLFQLSNAKYHAATAGQKVGDHKCILMLLSSNDIAGLHCLLAAALRRGADALTICGLLDHAISGLYSPRSGFTKCDLDIALLVKYIGGPHLLYALQKSQGFPSWRTIGRHYKIPKLYCHQLVYHLLMRSAATSHLFLILLKNHSLHHCKMDFFQAILLWLMV